MNQETCGSLYRDAFSRLPDSFSAGFICGQAEKVHSGACDACMVRPRESDMEATDAACRVAEQVYGLVYRTDGREIWLIRREAVAAWGATMGMEVNSPEYHRARAALCGIRDVDEKFHERFGSAVV